MLVLFPRENVNPKFAHCRAVDITVMLKGKDGAGPKLKDFKAYVDSNDVPEIAALKHDVEEFAKEFPTIGFEKVRMRGSVRTRACLSLHIPCLSPFLPGCMLCLLEQSYLRLPAIVCCVYNDLY